jgi:hypothetical protein
VERLYEEIFGDQPVLVTNLHSSLLILLFQVARTKQALTFATSFPKRSIQIILRIFPTISSILSNFDLDCVSVAYDGSQVFAHPRAIRAFNTGFLILIEDFSQS